MIKIGNTGIVGVYKGSTPITSIYKGIDKVFGSGDTPEYNPEDIVFKIVVEDNTKNVLLPVLPIKDSNTITYMRGTVDWGDGTTDSVYLPTNTGKVSSKHTYNSLGTYIVKFTPAENCDLLLIAPNIKETYYDQINIKEILSYGNRPISFTTDTPLQSWDNIKTYTDYLLRSISHFSSPYLNYFYASIGTNTLITDLYIGDLSNATSFYLYGNALKSVHFDNTVLKNCNLAAKLELITGNLDLSNTTTGKDGQFSYIGDKLTKFENISLGRIYNTGNYRWSASTNTFDLLSTCTIRNIGVVPNKVWNLESLTVWGTGSDEAKQSLIDSLITYGTNNTTTILLSQNTYNALTEDELTQITAKGYTITV